MKEKLVSRLLGSGDRPVNPRKSEVLTTLKVTILKTVVKPLGLVLSPTLCFFCFFVFVFFSIELEQIISQFAWKHKRPQIAKS